MENTAELLNGKTFSNQIKEEVAGEVKRLKSEKGIVPSLVAVRVGEDPASEVYVKSKVKTARDLGIHSEQRHMSADTTEEELLEVVRELNERDEVDAILVQLPLPDSINESRILEALDPLKDVDGFHPINSGRLFQGQKSLVPCTPAGILEMLKRCDIELMGAEAVVVGRSNIVGKPMALLLLKESATVTLCHSKTRDLREVCSRADILIAAVGVPGLIGEGFIKNGAVVVDVGMNRLTDADEARDFFPPDQLPKRLRTIEKRGSTLVGDVNVKAAMKSAAYFTPVPGGVGLLTVAMLMKNTVIAAKARRLQQTFDG